MNSMTITTEPTSADKNGSGDPLGMAELPVASTTPKETSRTQGFFKNPSIQLNKLRQAKNSVD